MDSIAGNGMVTQLAEYETPFADATVSREERVANEENSSAGFFSDFESPFAQTYEAQKTINGLPPEAGEFVQLLGELNDPEFSNSLYEMAAELEDTWSNKISNETAMGEAFIPFAQQQAAEYFAPFLRGTNSMIDKVAQQFSGNNLADYNEPEMERFFAELEAEQPAYSPAQEQLFGSIFNKIKSVVKKGVDLAKKGISAVGKILPVNIILGKLKGLIKPLLEKVLKFAIGKLPRNLQPYAQTLSKKFLNLETSYEVSNEETEVPASGELEALQTELDNHIAQLLFSPGEGEADQLVMEYESSSDTLDRNNSYETNGLNQPSLEAAREQFINELKNLQPGENPAPAIERFLPVAIMALRPVIKMALSFIGRQRIINFLAGLLAKLIGRYIPENVARPLAAKIIDVGLNTIGFETYEMDKPNVAYEAIANTIQETVQNMGALDEATLNDQEALTAQLLEAFETAAANNFPAQYIREELRPSQQQGMWVLKPRKGPRHFYKKYTHVFSITIDPQTAKTIKGFRGLPLANFLRDKLGLDPTKPIQARVHLYEAIEGTRLTHIAKYEKVLGQGSQRFAWVQLQPLTQQAAALLLKEPALGKNLPAKYKARRTHIAIGQRFYFLEIGGARLNITFGDHKGKQLPEVNYGRPGNSGDVQAVINFIKSEIRFCYYFSEEEAKAVVEKLNRNDFLGAALAIRYSVKNVLNDMLRNHVSSKVKIIHEAMPELYLENYAGAEEQFAPFAALGKALGSINLNAGKAILTRLMEQLVNKLSELANQAIAHYFKARAAEFKQAQAEPKDGVTLKIIWTNIQGMSGIKALISAIKGNLSLGNLSDLALPNIHAPEVIISAGKNFD